MDMVTVVATKDFEADGRIYLPGEAVTLSAIQAAVRAQAGEVSLLEAVPRPTYQTRDMTAVPVAPPVPAAAAAPTTSSEKPPRRRRRRTVKA